ncbi:hypothetical protein [Oryza sativa Japonica Group]|uniref:Uncharacterized protein n=2 Tax=Oryza sativa subsp. japonica TaxID=39947 RepID=Q5JLP3_ORYSJ|nr:hypothetical protein [Oryza sativa Japonica Group]BAD87614.1 hypothetical protein [Oryza sativa Japonica Group]
MRRRVQAVGWLGEGRLDDAARGVGLGWQIGGAHAAGAARHGVRRRQGIHFGHLPADAAAAATGAAGAFGPPTLSPPPITVPPRGKAATRDGLAVAFSVSRHKSKPLPMHPHRPRISNFAARAGALASFHRGRHPRPHGHFAPGPAAAALLLM